VSGNQEVAIQQAQGDLLSALSAYDVSLTAQYKIIPYMA